MEQKVIQLCNVIEKLQTAFAKQKHHVESYSCLLKHLVNQTHMGNPDKVLAAVKDLSAILDTVNIFNTAASLVHFSTSAQEDVQDVVKESKVTNLKPVDSAEDRMTLFNFNKIQLPDGHTGKCIVTKMIDKSQGLTYITVATDENAKIFCDLQEDCLKNGTYQWIPPSNTIFGFHDQQDDIFFRAICVNNHRKLCGNTIDIFLVDFGQYSHIDTADPFYILSKDFTNIPAQARLVKIEKINGQPYEPFSIDTVLQKRCCFHVIKATENLIFIDLIDEKAEMEDSDTSMDIMNQIFEPPNDFGPVDDTSLVSSSFGEAAGYTPETLPSEKPFPKFCDENDKISNVRVEQFFGADDLSEDEEFEGTSNAIKAVLGYVPRDDRDYCKFFDPKTLGCFKGPHCRKIHLPRNEEGWTQDTQPAKVSIASAELPEVGSEIAGLITCVVNPEVCYIHLNVDAVVKLFMMNDQIDDLVKSNQLETINGMLHKFDLVTAWFDGHWFRAQVVDFPINKRYRVRYVDYGNTMDVSKKELRKWCSEFDHVPFFANRVRIANVQIIIDKIVNATKFLQKTVMEGSVSNLKKIVIKIISIDPDITVTLMDHDGFDIGEQMVALELVDYRTVELPPKKI